MSPALLQKYLEAARRVPLTSSSGTENESSAGPWANGGTQT